MGNKIKGSLEDFRKDFEQDVRDYAKNIAKIMANDIADELTEEAHSAIKDFYSYHPKYYVRNYNFWNSYKRFCRSKNGIYKAGVELCVNELPDEYNYKPKKDHMVYPMFNIHWIQNKPEDVFWRVYDLGWHGVASILYDSVPIMSPTPHERILEKYNYIAEHLQEYDDIATKKAQKLGYKYLKW